MAADAAPDLHRPPQTRPPPPHGINKAYIINFTYYSIAMEEYQEKLIAVREYLREKSPQKMSISAISRNLEINRGTVAKYLDILRINGQVTMAITGNQFYTRFL